MVILFFQYLQEQHQQQQQEEQQQCHKEVKYTVTQFPQSKKHICSALQPSVCSKNKGVGGGGLWTPPLNQPLKRIKKRIFTNECGRRQKKYRGQTARHLT